MTFVFFINAFRSSHQSCYIKKLFLKIYQYLQKTRMLDSLFNKETRTWMFSCEYCEIFKNAYFEEHMGTDAFMCFPVSYRNFLCYFRKDFNYTTLKTPTMNLEKMLKIMYQKRNYFSSFCSAFLPSFLLSHKKAELKQSSRNR